jgi:hypothetical protein
MRRYAGAALLSRSFRESVLMQNLGSQIEFSERL